VAPDRSTAAFGFGALATVRMNLTPALALHVEGGPVSLVYERAIFRAGVAEGTETATPLTFFVAAGVVDQF
jgi:hypothetical protein